MGDFLLKHNYLIINSLLRLNQRNNIGIPFFIILLKSLSVITINKI
jgi:hypothetical protein